MKPVIRTIVDKNGAEETVFTPTARMILYSIFKGKNPGMADHLVCEKAKIDPQLPMRWRVKYGVMYTEWLEEACDQESGDDAAVLERVGMMQAVQPGNFQYWREMSKTKGVIKEEAPKQGLTINTDFTVIMAGAGGNLDAARRRLLSAARGLGDSGGAGVVELARLRGSQGEGVGAGHVQGRPLEMANALGPDRGRPEPGPAIPAISEQAAFAGSYEVLDEGEIPPGAQEPPDDGDLAL